MKQFCYDIKNDLLIFSRIFSTSNGIQIDIK